VDAPPPCTDGNTKAITSEDTVPHRLRDPSGGRSSRSPTTLPATEQWVGELLPDFAGVAITPEDET